MTLLPPFPSAAHSALRFIALLAGALLTGSIARAQPSQPCFDVRENVAPYRIVTDLCVGTTYLLRKCGGQLPFGQVRYDTTGMLPGTFLQPGTDSLVRFDTPGPVDIAQLTNTGGGGGVIRRTYQVYPTAAPRVSVVPCLRSVRVRLPDFTYGAYTVNITLNSSTPTATPSVPGAELFSNVVSGTAPATVRVVVTGVTLLMNPRRAACPSTPFDTTITLPALPGPPLIRLSDVVAPTAAHIAVLRLARLVPGTRYVVERGAALPAAPAWTTLPDTLRPTTDTFTVRLSGVPTARRHRYRVRPVGLVGCDAALLPDPTASNEAGAFPLTSATAAPGSVTVRWPDYPAAGTVLGWRLRRDGVEIQRLPAAARTATDPGAVGCPRRLCYEVAAVVRSLLSPTDTLFAFSADSCVRTPGAQPAAPRLTASFDLNNNLVLRARPATLAEAAEFTFFENRPTPPPISLGTTLTSAFLIPTPDTAAVRLSCYSAGFTDTCAQQSPVSGAVCPVVLNGQRTPDGLTAELRWTTYRPLPATAVTTIELLDDQTNAVVRTLAVAPGTRQLTDPADPQRQVLRYRVRVRVPTDTSQTVFSNFVDLIEEQLVRLPTAFTPNGDNLNDTFGPVGRYALREMEMTIFDRWGREVFRTTTPTPGWDGRAPGGDVVAPGVFAYRFRGRDAGGREFTQKGTVTVVR